MALKKEGSRIVGDVKFTCPICDKSYEKREVSIPQRGVGVQDLNIESVVVVPDDEHESGIGLRAELTMQCPNCNVTLKQFTRVST
jgi:uncharacterized protein (DUF2225 family)